MITTDTPADRKATAMTVTTTRNFVIVTVPTRDGDDGPIIPVALAGEPIAPGLLITPSIAHDSRRYRGGWTVTHQSSGRAVHSAVGFACIGCVRRAARQLTDAPVDWTRDMAEVIDDPAAIHAVGEFITGADRCNGHGCGTEAGL